MIYFNSQLVEQATKAIKKSHDLADVANDLIRINNAINTIGFPNGVQEARQLDAEMRWKYPMIDEMLRIANHMPHFQNAARVSIPQTSTYAETEECAALRQDMYGILCETLIKKGYTHSVEQFIERVDE